MMPATLVKDATVGRLVDQVDVFGDPDPQEPTRVVVKVDACLSFGNLLAMLMFTPGLNLQWSELDDDAEVVAAVRFAVIANDLIAMDEAGDYLTALYTGTAPRFSRKAWPTVSLPYLRHVGEAITRVYGVSA